MRAKFLWAAAFAMVFLVVTIPFYVADVFADSTMDRIIYPSPSGVNNATGFMMSSDTLTIFVNLRLEGIAAADAAKRVFVDLGSGEQFTSCNESGSGWYTCKYQSQLSDLVPGNYNGRVYIDAVPCTVCSLSMSLTIDTLPPSFSEFSITPAKTNKPNVTISYKASDRACESCGEKCSGIKAAKIYPSNDYSKVLAAIEVNQSPDSPSGCADARTLAVPVSDLASGNYSICIAATDNAGNMNFSQEKCSNLVVAREAPSVATPAITDQQGNILTYIPGGGVTAKILAQVTSNYADLTSATADLSAFQLPQQSMACAKQNDSRIWNCTAQFYALLTPDSTSQKVSISVLDDAENTGKTDFSFGLQADSTAPQLAAFRTNYMFKNFTFFGPKNNQIAVDLAETQSGFSKNMVYARDLQNLFDVYSAGATNLYRANCTKSGVLWTCSLPGIDLKSASSGKATITFEAYDDSSNKIEFSNKVIVDTAIPEIVSVEMDTQNAYPAIGAGENVVIRANITENSAMVSPDGSFNAYMDLSFIEGGKELRKADSCELINETYVGLDYNGSQWMCSWIVKGLKAFSGWVPIINASDIAGNKQLYTSIPNLYIGYMEPKIGNFTYKPVSSFDILPTQANGSNYWRVDMGPTIPISLDRQLLTAVSPYVYVPLVFTPLQGTADIIEVTLEKCENDGSASEINIFPNIPNASNIELKILNGNYATLDSLRYLCQIGIVSIANGEITQKEISNVTIGVGLYEMPLGKFDKKVKNKIGVVYKDVTGDWQKIQDFLKKTFDVMTQLCNILKMIGGIMAIFNVAAGGAHAALEACVETAKAGAAITAIPTAGVGTLIGAGVAQSCYSFSNVVKVGQKGLNDALGGFSKVAERTCQFVTCTLPGWQTEYKLIRDRMSPDFTKMLGGIKDAKANAGSGKSSDKVDTNQALPPEANPAAAATRFITGLAEGSAGAELPAGGSPEPATGGVEAGAGTPASSNPAPSPSSSSKTSTSASSKAQDTLQGLSDNIIQFWPKDMKSSLVLSTIFLCVPGVIYNLEKYRQIKCAYGLCLIQMASGGGPMEGCEKTYKVQLCLAVYGEVFNFIPYGRSMQSLGKFFEIIFHDPVSFVFFSANIACKLFPPTPSGNVAYSICAVTNIMTNILNWITQIFKMYTDIQTIVKQIEAKQNPFDKADMCKPFTEAYKNLK